MSDSFATPDAHASDTAHLSRATETVVRVGLVLILVVWCVSILRPFIVPVVWGAILAVAVFPVFGWLESTLGGSRKLAAGLLALAGLAVVIVPALLFAGSMIGSGQEVVREQDLRELHVPAPPESVKQWPVVGESAYQFWNDAHENLQSILVRFAPQLRAAALWLVGATVGTGLALAQALLSIVIAGVMLVVSRTGQEASLLLAKRVAGESGERIITMVVQTIRSVAVGIIGVAFIQAALISIGMVAVGVPHVGLWALLCLILAVLQLPPFLVVLPVIFYVFSVESTGVAVAFTVWELLAGASDNVLKPILLARGVSVPMLVIFMGAIGGFVMSGFIGLFLGAVVLSLGYEMARVWIGAQVSAGGGSELGGAATTAGGPDDAEA